jgi:transcriptional regulator of heat shock response
VKNNGPTQNPDNKQKTNIQNINRVSKQVREAVFLVRPDVQNDIYHLFYDASNDASDKLLSDKLLEHDVAGIPDYKTSVMMNRLFRNIKENQNLDALEESDDEDDEVTVFIDREIRMKCVYNNKYKKWCPLAETKEPITKNIPLL